MKKMLRFSILAFFLAVPPLYAQETATHWIKLGDDFHRDISGLVCLEKTDDGGSFLVAHDNKYSNETRIGLVVLSGDHLEYSPVPWPTGVTKLVDIEAFTAMPDGEGYLITTSKGDAAWLKIGGDPLAISSVETFKLPVDPRPKPQIEGLYLFKRGENEWLIYADRGSDDRPGTLAYSKFIRDKMKVKLLGCVKISVPWPTMSEVRHISDLLITDDGTLYISAASEPSNDGPFDGAIYIAGAFRVDDENQLQFDSKPLSEALYRFPGKKIEGFDILPGENGGFVVGTDDENLGSYLGIIK